MDQARTFHHTDEKKLTKWETQLMYEYKKQQNTVADDSFVYFCLFVQLAAVGEMRQI